MGRFRCTEMAKFANRCCFNSFFLCCENKRFLCWNIVDLSLFFCVMVDSHRSLSANDILFSGADKPQIQSVLAALSAGETLNHPWYLALLSTLFALQKHSDPKCFPQPLRASTSSSISFFSLSRTTPSLKPRPVLLCSICQLVRPTWSWDSSSPCASSAWCGRRTAPRRPATPGLCPSAKKWWSCWTRSTPTPARWARLQRQLCVQSVLQSNADVLFCFCFFAENVCRGAAGYLPRRARKWQQ